MNAMSPEPQAAVESPDHSGHVEANPVLADVFALRRLATQMHRRASGGEGHVLRAMMGKREALLNAIRSRIATEDADIADIALADCLPEMSAAQQQLIVETVAEIAAIDRDTERVLSGRMNETAAEIQKLRAGRKWRESSQIWA